MNRKQNYNDYGVVEPTCFGMRTLMGPYIDEPIVSGLDRCLRFFGVKVCKPNYCDQVVFSKNENRKTVVCVNDECVLTVGSETYKSPGVICQGTSTTSLCSDECAPNFSNIQDSITYFKGCLKKSDSKEDCNKKKSKTVNIASMPTEITNKTSQNVNIDDVPEIPHCSSPCNIMTENCELDSNATKVDPRFCTSKRSSPLQIVPSEKSLTNGLFVQDSLPFIPQCSFTACPVTATTYKTGLINVNESDASLIPIAKTHAPSKVSISPDTYIPERDKSPKGRNSSPRKPMLSPIMSTSDINIPERENCARSIPDSEDSYQTMCPLFKNECYTRSNHHLGIIPICNAANNCFHEPLLKSKTDIFTQYDCVDQKDAYTEPEEFLIVTNSTSRMLQTTKDSYTEPINFSQFNIPLNFSPTNRSIYSNPVMQLPFKILPDRKSRRNYDTAPVSSETPSPDRRKKSKDKKKAINLSIPAGATSIAGPSQVTSTQWAVCRINTFSNHTTTYQIMQAHLNLETVDENKTIMYFIVLKDGSAMSLAPDLSSNEC